MDAMPPLSPELREPWRRLLDHLGRLDSVLVAFSGGVDSSLLLAAACRALPGRIKAVTCAGPFTPPWELERARRLARGLGVEYREVDPGDLQDPEIRANDPLRCYYCKRRRLMLMTHMAQDQGYQAVVEGSQVDDADQDRPGRRAVEELGVESPLMAAGLDKETVRALSRALGLESADTPPGACLATRVPTGTPITPAALKRIARAEGGVRQLVRGQVRVRDHWPLARIELDPGAIAPAAAPPLRQRIRAVVEEAGYRQICLDLAGYPG